MKILISAMFLALLAGCSAPVADRSVSDSTHEAPNETTDPVGVSSSDPDFMPEAGGLSGDIGTFEDINAEAYEISISSNILDTYVYHDEGRVMTQLALTGAVADYLDDQSHTFLLNSNTVEFSALGCQSETLTYWDYDSQADSGIITVTPAGEDLWSIDYELNWASHQLQGFVTITRR